MLMWCPTPRRLTCSARGRTEQPRVPARDRLGRRERVGGAAGGLLPRRLPPARGQRNAAAGRGYEHHAGGGRARRHPRIQTASRQTERPRVPSPSRRRRRRVAGRALPCRPTPGDGPGRLVRQRRQPSQLMPVRSRAKGPSSEQERHRLAPPWATLLRRKHRRPLPGPVTFMYLALVASVPGTRSAMGGSLECGSFEGWREHDPDLVAARSPGFQRLVNLRFGGAARSKR